MLPNFIRRTLKRTVVPAIITTLALGGIVASTGFAAAGDESRTSAAPPAHDQLPIAANAAPPVAVATDLPKPPPPAPVLVVPPPPAAPAVNPFDLPHASWVMVPSVGINVAVGSYTDCSGAAPVPHGIAARDWCAVASTVYLIGHNPGVFTPLPGVHVGALVRYWDAAGQAFTYHVTSVTLQSRNNDSEIMTPGPPHLDFQTCANADGSMIWIVTAYPV